MHRTIMSLAIGALIAVATPARAMELGTRTEAVAMVKRVHVKFQSEGPDATFKAVMDNSNKEFRDRDLYPFIYTLEGVIVATGSGRTALVGKSLMSIKDQDGKYLVREMIEMAKRQGNGWIDYKWPNPATNKIESKSSYIELMGSYVVGVGIWIR